jgi:hypothetical protein
MKRFGLHLYCLDEAEPPRSRARVVSVGRVRRKHLELQLKSPAGERMWGTGAFAALLAGCSERKNSTRECDT